MNIDTQLAAGPGHNEHDGRARLMPDGVGHQFAGKQGRGVRVDGGFPATDGRLDLAAGLRYCGRSRLQPDAARLPRRIERRHRIHRIPPRWSELAREDVGRRAAVPRGKLRAGLAVLEIGCKANTAATCNARHRSADGFWNDDWR